MEQLLPLWETVKAHPIETILVIGGSVALVVLFYFLYIAWNTKRSIDYDDEAYFTTEKGTRAPFPTISDAPTRTVTVVVPAYKEAKRIHKMLNEMLEHLHTCQRRISTFTWEIVVVDDGSPPAKDGTPDQTTNVVQRDYVNPLGSDKIRICKLVKNLGKGGAVRKGVLRSRGQYILFADADGATQASDLYRLFEEVQKTEKNGLGIAVGSRRHDDEGTQANRTIIRRFLGWTFHTLISIFVGGHGIRDTQCGFKMFTRQAAAQVFPIQHIERWAFDVELLFLAAHFHIPMIEVPVTWNEIDGSTLSPVEAALQMFRDVFIIRLAYTTGVWRYYGYKQVQTQQQQTKKHKGEQEGEETGTGNEQAVKNGASSSTRKRK